MLVKQLMKSTVSFWIKASSPGPWTNGEILLDKGSHEQVTTGFMKVFDIFSTRRKHLSTHHAINEPNGTNSTKICIGEVSHFNLDDEVRHTQYSGNGFVNGSDHLLISGGIPRPN